ncbi:CsbD family protein [Demequina sp.]|uniref:CsbD family protein n=1 Tax=Demequina sp. TaxID=2050685 RepID=UPI003A87447C
MGSTDRLSNAAEDAKGKVKEAAGRLTDNEQLEAEGKFDQAKADAKDTVEDAKDAVAEKYNEATDRDK